MPMVPSGWMPQLLLKTKCGAAMTVAGFSAQG